MFLILEKEYEFKKEKKKIDLIFVECVLICAHIELKKIVTCD